MIFIINNFGPGYGPFVRTLELSKAVYWQLTQKLAERIESIIRKEINLSPRGIRETLKLNNPIYKPTSSYGHFGRDPGADGTFTWEKTDLTDIFKRA